MKLHAREYMSCRYMQPLNRAWLYTAAKRPGLFTTDTWAGHLLAANWASTYVVGSRPVACGDWRHGAICYVWCVTSPPDLSLSAVFCGDVARWERSMGLTLVWLQSGIARSFSLFVPSLVLLINDLLMLLCKQTRGTLYFSKSWNFAWTIKNACDVTYQVYIMYVNLHR